MRQLSNVSLSLSALNRPTETTVMTKTPDRLMRFPQPRRRMAILRFRGNRTSESRYAGTATRSVSHMMSTSERTQPNGGERRWYLLIATAIELFSKKVISSTAWASIIQISSLRRVPQREGWHEKTPAVVHSTPRIPKAITNVNARRRVLCRGG